MRANLFPPPSLIKSYPGISLESLKSLWAPCLMLKAAFFPLSIIFEFWCNSSAYRINSNYQSFLLSVTVNHQWVRRNWITWKWCKVILKYITWTSLVISTVVSGDSANLTVLALGFRGERLRIENIWVLQTWSLTSLFLFIKVACILGQPWLNHITTNAVSSVCLIPLCFLCVWMSHYMIAL